MRGGREARRGGGRGRKGPPLTLWNRATKTLATALVLGDNKLAE